MRLTVIPLSILLSLSLPAVTAAADSGIRGVVILGPLTPSLHIGDPVHVHPLETSLTIFNAQDDSVAATVRTRPNGTFSVSLPPGEYVVGPAVSSQIRLPSIEPVAVTVTPHSYAEVTVNADSGIR
jgi:hypothetical protein